MKKLLYAEVTHDTKYRDGNEKYIIDWTRNEEKYKLRNRWLRVYQGGRISIHTNTYRDPGARYDMRNAGVEFVLTSELRGKLYTPGGERVSKKDIAGDIALVDFEFNRVLFGREFFYVAPGYPPESTGTTLVSTRDRDREEAFKVEHKDTLDLAVTMHAMCTNQYFIDTEYNVARIVEHFITTPTPLDPMTKQRELSALGWAQTISLFDTTLARVLQNRTKVAYLTMEK